MRHFDLNRFIKTQVTGRHQSLLTDDLVNFQQELYEKVNGKSVMVIGGAGSIGASFIKAILPYSPSRLFVIDTNENGLTELTRDLRSSASLAIPKDYKTYPFNFGDPVFEKMFYREGSFDIVANFAAHKHVRSEKDQYSIEALVDNNVLKAKHLLDFLSEQTPEHFFCVSTDKAANPVNVMGASKKLMEDVILAYSKQMRITTARFANVAFSNGSLLAGFIERMMKKQPLSAPRDIRRYFVSPEESGQICMLACLLGESGDIFFPKLEEREMKTFSEIAEKLLHEFGFQPDYCRSEDEARLKSVELNGASTHYPVYFFESDTSGEKPFEEFFTREELVINDHFESLGVIKPRNRKSLNEIEEIFKSLQNIFNNGHIDKSDIVELLTGVIPGFQHMETGINLDQRM